MTEQTNTQLSVDLTTDNTTDLKESMASMMSEMMSVMKDDMLRQFEEYFAAPEPEANIDDKLAYILSDLVKGTLPKTKLDEVLNKYPRPENCESLVVPNVNKIVSQHLKQSVRTTDSAMQKCKKLFTSAMYAIIQACEQVTGDVRTILTHALVLAMSGNS
jgi:hypothetical protein